MPFSGSHGIVISASLTGGTPLDVVGPWRGSSRAGGA